MFFLCIVADAICLLTAIAHTVYVFFCIITIELFWSVRLCHLTFVTLTHSFCAICLCPALAQVIFLYVTMIFLTLVHAILFCWVSIRCVSFFHDRRCPLSLLLGTSKCYLSLVALPSPYIAWFL